MKRYKRLSEKQPLKEMAYIGEVNGLIIQVYNDHGPPHFHVIKKDEFEVKIEIDTLNVLSYKWQKGNTEISSKELKELQKWLDKNYDKDIKNCKAIKVVWKALNP